MSKKGVFIICCVLFLWNNPLFAQSAGVLDFKSLFKPSPSFTEQKPNLKNGLIIDTFPNGRTKQIAFYFNDVPQGMMYSYFDNGFLASKGAVYHGKRIGVWKEYFYLNGEIQRYLNYDTSTNSTLLDIRYYEQGNIWHYSKKTNDFYNHFEYYLTVNGDTQYLHSVQDSAKRIYNLYEYHMNGQKSLIGLKQYSPIDGWKNIGTWKWFNDKGILIREKKYISI